MCTKVFVTVLHILRDTGNENKWRDSVRWTNKKKTNIPKATKLLMAIYIYIYLFLISVQS